MTPALTAHQTEALSWYADLMAARPALFAGRRRRPIVRDLDTIERYAAEHRVVLGVAAKTSYLWLLNDLVASRTVAGAEVLHPYLRIIQPLELAGVTGVVVVATIAGDQGGEEPIVMIRQDRHATGSTELELPRGFGTAGAGPEADALRELEEETGYSGAPALLGRTVTDSGTSDSAVSFVHVAVAGRSDATPEVWEAIDKVVLMTRDELWQAIDRGEVRDGFTVQALSLYERSLAHTSQ